MTSTMDAANKQKALDDQYAALKAGMTMYQDVEGLDLDNIINPSGSTTNLPTGTDNATQPATGGLGDNPGGGDLMIAQQEWDNAMSVLAKPSTQSFGENSSHFDKVGYDNAIKAWKDAVTALGPRPA